MARSYISCVVTPPLPLECDESIARTMLRHSGVLYRIQVLSISALSRRLGVKTRYDRVKIVTVTIYVTVNVLTTVSPINRILQVYQ